MAHLRQLPPTASSPDVHNHFNLERQLIDRETYKTSCSAVPAEWQLLMA